MGFLRSWTFSKAFYSDIYRYLWPWVAWAASIASNKGVPPALFLLLTPRLRLVALLEAWNEPFQAKFLPKGRSWELPRLRAPETFLQTSRLSSYFSCFWWSLKALDWSLMEGASKQKEFLGLGPSFPVQQKSNGSKTSYLWAASLVLSCFYMFSPSVGHLVEGRCWNLSHGAHLYSSKPPQKP